jgi:circadian locomoter output cycle kaput protein
MVSAGNRKMDKTTVLKTTIAYLRQHEEISARNQVDRLPQAARGDLSQDAGG